MLTLIEICFGRPVLTQFKALLHSHLANSDHVPDSKAIALSTYGIMFFGTPHRGAKGAEIGRFLLNIQSLVSQAQATIVQNLGMDSEYLRTQLSLYTKISGKFDTKFFYEVYKTPITGGKIMVSCMLVFSMPSAQHCDPACPKGICCDSRTQY
jgi:hypothetical protein